MDVSVEECESVLSLLSSMKVKVQTALETINNCNSPPSCSVPVESPPAVAANNIMDKSSTTGAAKIAEDAISRDEVKAQREKKKAEKLAKKNQSKEKSKGGSLPVNEEQGVKSVGKVGKADAEVIKKQEPPAKEPQPEKRMLKEKNIEKVEAAVVKKEKVDGGEKEKVPAENNAEKSKAQLKAERRAIQEAQRAAKAAGAGTKENSEKKKPEDQPPAAVKKGTDQTPSSKKVSSGVTVQEKLVNSTLRPKAISKRHVSESKMQTLFDHLPHSRDSKSLFQGSQSNLDAVFVTLGQKYANGVFTSSKERCIQLVITLQEYISKYKTPPGKDFKYALAQSLKGNLEFLQKCRPFAVAMENAVEHFNHLLRGLQSESESGENEQEIKEMLDEELSRFVDERINKAKDAIVREGKRKIKNGDVLLIFGCSELVWSIINEAAEKNSFCLVIVRDMSQCNDSVKDKILSCIEAFINKRKSLGDTNVSVDYIGITGLSNRIQTVTKVLLDAEGLLANGKVMARAGTSEIALMASEHNIPVLVCCETYKFCDKSPTDSFSLNELKNRTDQFDSNDNYDGYLKTPELVYDITPSELVTAVITDVDMLPSTSVPVVLRVQENRSRNT